MSFVTKLGDNAAKDQKLVLLRRKYFRNILEFNQVWQQEKKDTEIKIKQEQHDRFEKVVRKEFEALESEKEKIWRQKMNNQDILKHDYDNQIVEREFRFRQQKEKDKEFVKQQEVENDKVSERRLLDLLKIYDRKTVKNSSQRRLKTDMDSFEKKQSKFTTDSSGQPYPTASKGGEPIRQLFLPLNYNNNAQVNPETRNNQTRDQLQSKNKGTLSTKKPEEDPQSSRDWHLPRLKQTNDGKMPFAGMRSGGQVRSLKNISRDGLG